MAITNSTAPIDNVNVFGITNSAGQAGRWIRVDIRGTGTNGPVGPAGGALTGTYPSPGVNLSTTNYITGDLPLSNIVQIANNTLLGNFTGSTADIQVLSSITSANLLQVLSDETGTGVAVFGTAPTFTTSITVNGTATISSLTSGRIPIVSTGGLLIDDADLTFATDTLTATKIVGSTSITDSGLTATRVTFAGTGGLLSDDADMTFATDTLTAVKVVAPTSVSTPLIITASGDLNVTPAAGSSVKINTSTTGNFIVNTSLLVANVSSNAVGIGTATPNLAAETAALTISGGVAGDVVGALDLQGSRTGSDGRPASIRAYNSVNQIARLDFLKGGADTNSGQFQFVTYNAGTPVTAVTITKTGMAGFGGFTAPLASVATPSLHVGGESAPGDNNLLVDGTTESTGLITATASLNYPSATASTAAVWNGSKTLISSITTLTELSYVSGVTSAIQTQLDARSREPILGTGNPIADNETGYPGQFYINTTTGDKWISIGDGSGGSGTGTSWIH